MTEAIKTAAAEIDALPSNRREAVWMMLWNGIVISFLVFFLEYAVWAPSWTYVVLPAWHWLVG